jgi:hypothetical protein
MMLLCIREFINLVELVDVIVQVLQEARTISCGVNLLGEVAMRKNGRVLEGTGRANQVQVNK